MVAQANRKTNSYIISGLLTIPFCRASILKKTNNTKLKKLQDKIEKIRIASGLCNWFKFGLK